MKPCILAATVLVCTLAWIASADDAGATKGQNTVVRHEPNSGYVGDAATALAIGKTVLSGLLTQDDLLRKEFSEAKLKDGVWTVSYWALKTTINLPVVIRIRQKTGAIIGYEDPNA